MSFITWMILANADRDINSTAWISYLSNLRITDSSGWWLSPMFLALDRKEFLLHRSSLKRGITRLQLRTEVYSRESRLFSSPSYFLLPVPFNLLPFYSPRNLPVFPCLRSSYYSLSFDLGLS